jgi:LacI family transcriptional regulator
MKDIANDLGVSLMTVSKAWRDHSDISEETRLRVRQRARELDYEPNLVARSLVIKRTFLVGLIVPDLMHCFFAEIAKGVASKLGSLGYQIVISDSDENEHTELDGIRGLIAHKVDGLIIASAAVKPSRSLRELLNARKTHCVLVDRMILGVRADYVGVKDEKIGILATEHLIDQGCTRIAHLYGPTVSTGKGKLQGYRRALAKHGLKAAPEYMISGRYDTGHSAMQRLLELDPRPDGVFSCNDPLAAGALKAIIEAGLDVPRDIAVIGVGNTLYSDLTRVPLSTVDLSSFESGRTAAELLLGCMQSKQPEPPRQVYIEPKLVVRDSSQRRK